jgi:hypothetical protein
MKTLSKFAIVLFTMVVMTTCKSKPQSKQIKGNYPTQIKLQENPKA